jgi:hypothetical protein
MDPNLLAPLPHPVRWLGYPESRGPIDLVPLNWAIVKVRFWGEPRTKNEEKETHDGRNHPNSTQGG